jgi:hypothetical protein
MGLFVVSLRHREDRRHDPPYSAAERLAFLDRDDVHRQDVPRDRRNQGAVEGHLMQVAERPHRELERVDIRPRS